jgi:hypothetical protein
MTLLIALARHLALPAARSIALATVLATTNAARAEEPRQSHDAPTLYTFDDDKVLADTVGPMGEVMMVRKRPQRGSLVRARDSFVVELLRSVEAL